MKIKPIAVPALTLLGGILIGHLLPREIFTTAQDPSGNGAPARTRSASSGSTLTDNPGKRARHSTTTPGAPAPSEQESMIRVPASLIAQLSLAGGVRRMDQSLFSADGKIEEALHITDQEKALVQTAWRDSQQKIRDLETASMKSKELDEWSVRITVPDLSTSLASLGDGFRARVLDALGQDRAQAFLAVKQVDHLFAPPVGQRVYTVTSEAIGNGQWRFRVSLEGPEGKRVWVGEKVPEELQHLTKTSGIVHTLTKP